MSKPPLHHYKFCLPFRAVHIQCIDCDGKDIKSASASGFIVNEDGQLFLYTCWHVVTGYEPFDLKIGRDLPIRAGLKVIMQDHEIKQPGVTAIGGNRTITIPLYIEKDEGRFPVWIQEERDQPHEDLNGINIKVPSLHDVVKIALPAEVAVSDIQVLSVDDLFMNSPAVGDKLHIVGFPYGYSALGMEQPTPVVLTRFLAADSTQGQVMNSLLDGPGAPGMSGAPVFVEHDEALYLTGIYTGLIYPDYAIEKNEKTTALGTYCNMVLWWKTEAKIPTE